MDDLEAAACRELEYTDDVYTNAGKLCVGRKSGSKIWMGRVEHVGSLPCDRSIARVFAGHGYHVRG